MDDETLAITLVILVDEWYQREGARMGASRPGPKPQCTDTEILALSLLRLLNARMFGKALPAIDADQSSGLVP